ncbi:hypothetical protein Chor_016692 [Crotalus horridus]
MASFLKMLDCLSLVNKNHCQSSLCRTLVDGHHARWFSGYQRPGTSVEKISPRKAIGNFKNVVEELKIQYGLVKKEVADFMKEFDQKPMEDYLLNQTKVIWEFRSEEDLNKWVLGSDTAIGGKSEICLKLDKNKQYAVLSGNLNTTVPRDGVTKYSGYCAMVSKPEMVPFSKFFFTSHGRIQDGQYEMWSDRISTLGLTLADKVDGPFQLDIDFIGLLSDKSHTETFAYELYERNPQKQNK